LPATIAQSVAISSTGHGARSTKNIFIILIEKGKSKNGMLFAKQEAYER